MKVGHNFMLHFLTGFLGERVDKKFGKKFFFSLSDMHVRLTVISYSLLMFFCLRDSKQA